MVQAIKRPTLLEITGPLFMSYPVVSNVQYRLTEADGGTLIKFHHTALGLIPDDHKKGMAKGWTHILTCSQRGPKPVDRTEATSAKEELMCPACMASAALMAGGVITTGGLTALVVKIFHTKEVRRRTV